MVPLDFHRFWTSPLFRHNPHRTDQERNCICHPRRSGVAAPSAVSFGCSGATAWGGMGVERSSLFLQAVDIWRFPKMGPQARWMVDFHGKSIYGWWLGVPPVLRNPHFDAFGQGLVNVPIYHHPTIGDIISNRYLLLESDVQNPQNGDVYQPLIGSNKKDSCLRILLESQPLRGACGRPRHCWRLFEHADASSLSRIHVSSFFCILLPRKRQLDMESDDKPSKCGVPYFRMNRDEKRVFHHGD